MTLPTALSILRRIRKALLIRLEDLDPSESSLLTANQFFDELYVHVDDLEAELLGHMTPYERPILLLGKQGIGKTTLLEYVVSLQSSTEQTILRFRCTAADRDHYRDFSSIENMIRDVIRHELSKDGKTLCDLLHLMLVAQPTWLTETTSLARRKLHTMLHEHFMDTVSKHRNAQAFPEWLLSAFLTNRNELRDVVKRFEAEMDLSTYAELICTNRGPNHHILLLFDNLESLLDLTLIKQATGLLVRIQQLFKSTHVRMIVCSRPRSFFTAKDKLVPLPDAGHNIYLTVDFSKHLQPIVTQEDDSDPAANVPDSELTRPSVCWQVFEKRFLHAVQGTISSLALDQAAALENRHLERILATAQREIEAAPACANLLNGLANHSYRAYLITVVNFVEDCLRDTAQGQLAAPIVPDFFLDSISKVFVGITDMSKSSALMSKVLQYVGACGALIPGVQDNRPKLASACARYRSNGEFVAEDFLSLYCMLSLGRCRTARYDSDGRPRAKDVYSRRVGDISAQMALFGFDQFDSHDTLVQLVQPDLWDLQTLEYSSPGNAYPQKTLGKNVELQLESRAWLMSRLLPYRLHYWLGEISARENVPRSPVAPVLILDVLSAIDLVLVWAEIEAELIWNARSSSSSWEVAFEQYAETFHTGNRWCFQLALKQFQNYVVRLGSSHHAPSTTDSTNSEFLRALAREGFELVNTLSSKLVAELSAHGPGSSPVYGPASSEWSHFKHFWTERIRGTGH